MVIRLDHDMSQGDVRDPGHYEATITQIKETVSQGPKTRDMPMLKITYRPTDGGKQVYDQIILGEAFDWKLKNFLNAVGVDESEMIEGAEFDPQEFIGQTVVLKLGVETATDQWPARNRVEKVFNPSEVYATAGAGSRTSW